MKTYNKSYRKVNLADSQRLSTILIDKIRILFPIRHETTIQIIFKYIDARLKMNFDINIIEVELLRATKEIKLQFLIKNYFHSLREYFKPDANRKAVTIETFRRKNVVEPCIVKPLKETAYESRKRELEELKEIKERWEEEKKMSKTLKSLKGLWEPSVGFNEYDGDVLHTK